MRFLSVVARTLFKSDDEYWNNIEETNTNKSVESIRMKMVTEIIQFNQFNTSSH